MTHFGKGLIDIANKARGRTPVRYEFEVIPFFAGELPSGIDRCMFCWERGTKTYVTDAETVNPTTHAVFWKQYLKQQSTLYKTGDKVGSKEYTFKVQTLGATEHDRKTVGKVRVDLAQFCSGDAEPEAHDVVLQLKPQGKLKISIKATWLRDERIDPDQMTEASFKSSELTGKRSVTEEQDLSGFDASASYPLPAPAAAPLPLNPPVPPPAPSVPAVVTAAIPADNAFATSKSHNNSQESLTDAQTAAHVSKGKGLSNMYQGVKGLVVKDKTKDMASSKLSQPGLAPAPLAPPQGPTPADLELAARERQKEAEAAKIQADQEQEKYQKMLAEITQRVRQEVEAEYSTQVHYVCCCIPVRSRPPKVMKEKLINTAKSAELPPV